MSDVQNPVDQSEPRRRRGRWAIGPWLFLVINFAFLTWVIAAAAGSGGEECRTLDAQTCKDASEAGTAIGIFLIVMFWAAVDVILGFLYLVFKLARR